MMKKSLVWLVTALACSQVVAAETGVALKADQLRADTFSDAKVVGSVNKNDAVDILTKKGAWLQIKVAGKTGWVRLLTVKRNSAGGSNVAGVVGVATGRSGTARFCCCARIRP